MPNDIRLLSADVFLPHMGSDFSFLRENEVLLTPKLTYCKSFPRGTMPGTARMAFSMLFEMPVNQMLPGQGGTFFVRHDIIGEFGPVHVSRIISTQPDVATLEIIFN